MDDLQIFRLTMLHFNKEIGAVRTFFFFLCNLFHLSQVTEFYSMVAAMLQVVFCSQCYSLDLKIHPQLNVLCIQIRKMRLKKLDFNCLH